MDYRQTLRDIGLEKKEAAIYVAALELGTASAAAIAKKAGIQRTHFYDLSEKLLARGFLQRTTAGTRSTFSAVDPSLLVEMEEEKLRKLKEALPEFKALYNTTGQRPRIMYFEGKEGIDQINEDTLRYKGEMIGFTTPRFVTSRTRNTGAAFIRKRVATDKHARVIGEDSPEVRDLQKRDKQELRETRILAPSVFSSAVEIILYGNRLAIVDYKHQWGFIIEGTEIVQAMKMIFEVVWSRWER